MRLLVFFLLAAGVFAVSSARPSDSKGRSTDDNQVDEPEPDAVDNDGVYSQETVKDQDDSGHLESDDVKDDGFDDEYAVEETGDDNTVDDGNGDDKDVDGSEVVTSKNAITEKTTATSDSKVLQTGNKRRKTKSGISKKQASQLLPLLMIPLMIQMQLIPMMLLKLKMIAVKALMLGKAALIIILLNVLRNTLLGADSMEEQYEQHSLASSHYGYSGMPEVGAWINRRRVYHEHPNGPYRGHEFVASPTYSGRSLSKSNSGDEHNT